MVSISIVSCDTYLMKQESLRFDKKECYVIMLSEAHICWDSKLHVFLTWETCIFYILLYLLIVFCGICVGVRYH